MDDEPIHPTMADILEVLDRLADRVAQGSSSRLDGFISLSLRRTMEEFRRFIPGLDTPPDAEGARFLARSAVGALEDGDASEALRCALKGLALAPHHPGLWYIVGSACFEFGAVEDAVRALRHTLWIHPGHRPARRDLSALNLYLRDRWEGPGENFVQDQDLPPAVHGTDFQAWDDQGEYVEEEPVDFDDDDDD